MFEQSGRAISAVTGRAAALASSDTPPPGIMGRFQTTMSLTTRTRLGPHEDTAKIGQGGMGRATYSS